MARPRNYMRKHFWSAGKAFEKWGHDPDAAFREIDLEEFAKGVNVEREHTTSLKVAARIALDHLAEFPDYYTHLEKMERELARRRKRR